MGEGEGEGERGGGRGSQEVWETQYSYLIHHVQCTHYTVDMRL